MILREISMWTYSEKEIRELQPEFEAVFNTKLIRDYENDWEWIWNGEEPKNKINISREHNWSTGEFSKPLRINISWNPIETEQRTIIEKIQSVVKSDLHFGKISNRGINIDDYEATKTIKYET